MGAQQTTAVLGFGVTGQSVVRHLLRGGHNPVVLDTRPMPPQIATEFERVQFHWNCSRWPALDVAQAVVSPGLALDSCLVRGAQEAGVALLSDIDLFFQQANAPVIAITGTNGKSTVTSLVAHMLQHAGRNCGAGGNLGDAALDLLDDEREFYVLELSSFQLQRSGVLPLFSAAILNVTEDHLDVHGNMEQYRLHKHAIFAAAERVVFNRDDALTHPHADLQSRRISFGLNTPVADRDWGVRRVADTEYLVRGKSALMPVAELPLAGAHNTANALAACALLDDVLSFEELAAGLKTFTGLAHRFAVVATIGGVTYINDSKATNLGATQAALAGIEASGRVLLIAGGDAKGVDLSPLAEFLVGRVRCVVCLGKDADHVAAVAQQAQVEAIKVASLEQAVQVAAQQAREADMVLLSPACASLDMFASFAERGHCFERAVQTLVSEGTRECGNG